MLRGLLAELSGRTAVALYESAMKMTGIHKSSVRGDSGDRILSGEQPPRGKCEASAQSEGCEAQTCRLAKKGRKTRAAEPTY